MNLYHTQIAREAVAELSSNVVVVQNTKYENIKLSLEADSLGQRPEALLSPSQEMAVPILGAHTYTSKSASR